MQKRNTPRQESTPPSVTDTLPFQNGSEMVRCDRRASEVRKVRSPRGRIMKAVIPTLLARMTNQKSRYLQLHFRDMTTEHGNVTLELWVVQHHPKWKRCRCRRRAKIGFTIFSLDTPA